MAPLIEDYGLIGDLQTAALVSRDASIDWCCFPRFDSDACFAALLGTQEHGCWWIRPSGAGFFKRSLTAGKGVQLRVWSPRDRAYSPTLTIA